MTSRILVVDDEPDFLRVIRSRLEAEHYEVLTVSDGKQALEIIRQEKPDVVLLDIMMPGMDGLEVLRKIRRDNKTLPVFILTAYSNEARFKEARKLKASGFLNKSDHLGEGIKNVTSVLRIASRYRKG